MFEDNSCSASSSSCAEQLMLAKGKLISSLTGTLQCLDITFKSNESFEGDVLSCRYALEMNLRTLSNWDLV